MENWEDILLVVLGADTGVLALIVALAAIVTTGVGFWAAVQLSKGGRGQ